MTSAKFYFIYIPLIYRESLAGLRTTVVIYEALFLFCQHWAGEEQVAAGAALMASASAGKKPALNVLISEMN